MSKIMLSVSFVLAGLMPVLSYAAPTAPQPVYMTSQIQRLLNEKQEKISKLEECDGKRKGFMIAGISTLGLTAVGVGVNIAQASKSNKLSNQIADQNLELEKQQNNLANINSQISEKQSDQARRECEENSAMQWVDGRCVPKTEQPVAGNTPEPAKEYDGKIGDSCGEGKVWFVTFNNPTKKCLGMSGIVSCDCIPGERYDGIIGNPCTSNGDGSVISVADLPSVRQLTGLMATALLSQPFMAQEASFTEL